MSDKKASSPKTVDRRRVRAYLNVLVAETSARGGAVFLVEPPAPPYLMSVSQDYHGRDLDQTMSAWKHHSNRLRAGRLINNDGALIVPLFDGGPPLKGVVHLCEPEAGPTRDPRSEPFRALAHRLPAAQHRDDTEFKAEPCNRETLLRAALVRANGNVSEAARILKIGRRTAYMWMEALAINPADYR